MLIYTGLSLAPTAGQPLTGTYSRPASHWHLQQASLSQAPTAGQMNSLSIIKINLSPFEMKAPNTV